MFLMLRRSSAKTQPTHTEVSHEKREKKKKHTHVEMGGNASSALVVWIRKKKKTLWRERKNGQVNTDERKKTI